LPISAGDVIEPAFQHTKQMLLRPFRFGQWVRLAFVGLLAGEMSSFGGCNFNLPADTQNQGSPQAPSGDFPTLFTHHPALFTGLALALIAVTIVLLVLFTYISSVMQFVLFDSIVARECHVRHGWTRRKQPGFRLFLWRLLLMLAVLAVLLIVIAIPAACAWAAGWFTHARDHVLGLVFGGLILFLILIALIVFAAVVGVMTKDFVVPQMALENLSVMEGWRRLWQGLRYEKGGYAAYIGIKIGLTVAATIVFAIGAIIALVVLLIIFGGVGGLGVLGGHAAGWSWNLYTISAAVTFGLIALVLLLFAVALICVPIIVFFPAYAIYFFAARYPPLASLLWPEPPAPDATGEPPPVLAPV
jgi:hypothetical protein